MPALGAWARLEVRRLRSEAPAESQGRSDTLHPEAEQFIYIVHGQSVASCIFPYKVYLHVCFSVRLFTRMFRKLLSRTLYQIFRVRTLTVAVFGPPLAMS